MSEEEGTRINPATGRATQPAIFGITCYQSTGRGRTFRRVGSVDAVEDANAWLDGDDPETINSFLRIPRIGAEWKDVAGEYNV